MILCALILAPSGRSEVAQDLAPSGMTREDLQRPAPAIGDKSIENLPFLPTNVRQFHSAEESVVPQISVELDVTVLDKYGGRKTTGESRLARLRDPDPCVLAAATAVFSDAVHDGRMIDV
jgi:hypothetical protein